MDAICPLLQSEICVRRNGEVGSGGSERLRRQMRGQSLQEEKKGRDWFKEVLPSGGKVA